jgi:1-acyl-sn-glycerol-3-phosphate acyltransferase
LIAVVRTLATFVGVSTYVVVAGIPALVWTLLVRDPRLLYRVGELGLWLGLTLAGIRLEVVGRENILKGQPAVYAANHRSSIEPPVVFFALRSLFPDLSILYKAELRRLPILVWVFDAAGFVPLERANSGQSLPAVDRASKTLAGGRSFVIFPEGTRSRTSELLPFKKGGFVMAIQAQAPVVPVAVSGSGDALKRGSMVIRSGTVRVEFAPPIPTKGLTFADRSDLVNSVRDAIASRLAST